ncbi:hypothetical protein IL306_009762 [Fusarium sp. DS 682]|nr:hypothetical protein IL306_009762 [Fusarium sp. DS 682]
MDPFYDAKDKAGDDLLKIARLATFNAKEKPNDEDAQLRAQVATLFVEKMGCWNFGPTSINIRACKSLPSDCQKSLMLPNEIYRLIIGHVATFPSKLREKTLIALSCSCSLLNGWAEEHLYEHPRGLQNYEVQWRFLFSLRIRPMRASLVRSLKLDWSNGEKNNRMLLDIITSCSNIDYLFVKRSDGGDDPTTVYSDHFQEIQTILSTGTRIKSLHYYTTHSGYIGWDDENQDRIAVDDPAKELSNWISNHANVEQSIKQLEHLGLDGDSIWLLGGIYRYLSSNLTSLDLGRYTELEFRRDLFFEISRRCQHLKLLVLKTSVYNTDDFEKAYQVWANTLETLKFSFITEMGDWFSRAVSQLDRLKVLHFGLECNVSVDGVNAIAQAGSRLEEISIQSTHYLGSLIYDSTDDSEIYQASGDADIYEATDDANEVLAKMIKGHSSSLRILELDVHIGEIVLQSCKTARNLRALDISIKPGYKPRSADIDDLLDACPELDEFPEFFREFSGRWTEWENRMFSRLRKEYGSWDEFRYGI